MKKVSIIMPVYNGEEYLREAIESIITQTYKNIELIIVCEQGSSIESINIIKEYAEKDNRIIYIQNEKREGISESLNIGLRMAKGEYIARMDSDDISLPTRIETQVNFLEKNKEIVLCGIQPTFFGENKMEWNVDCDSNFISHSIFFYSPCVHPTIMLRANIMKENSIYYNKDYKASEDYDFLAKFSLVGKITNINDKTLFKYRLHNTNATYTNNDIGLINYSKIMKELFIKQLNLDFTEDEINLLNCHLGLKNYYGKTLIKKYIEIDLLLKKILVKSYYNGYDINTMFKVLQKRFYEIKNDINNNHSVSKEIIGTYLDASIFNYNNFNENFLVEQIKNPEISVLLPVYNSENYILDSILSVLNQSFKNYELIILYEYGITDNTLEYINAIKDSRIKVVKNSEKLGLAASLNQGIKLAKGKYIARIDSDDLALENRFIKQYELFENNPDIDICSTWQKHFGPNHTWIHETPAENEKIKALLLFECCICHSTVMLRKDKFLKHNLFYKTDIRQEDYELWSRATDFCNFAVIEEILGLYRLHDSNITFQDLNDVSRSQVSIVKNNMNKLNINTTKYRDEVFIGFQYLYDDIPNLKNEAFQLFNEIIEKNEKLKLYNENALQYAINKRRNWINKEETPANQTPLSVSHLIKKILYPIYKKFKYRMEIISERQIAINNEQLNIKFESLKKEMIEHEISLINKINLLETEIEKLKKNEEYIKYKKGSKIRIALIMQAASFWPSFESVYDELINDTRFTFKLFLLENNNKNNSQFNTCEKFLVSNNIKYTKLTMDELKSFNPHIAVMQTPYDKWHRDKEFYAENLKKMGIRLVYIPYGIEFAGLDNSINLQFGTPFFSNMWRIYTINETIKEKYCIYSNIISSKIRPYGNPKFDALYKNKQLSNLPLNKVAKGRKIVMVKIHFPLVEKNINSEVMYTPDLQVYIDLLKNVKKCKGFCFIVMAHPKLFDNRDIPGINELLDILNKNKDIYIFNEDDYRQLLYEADYFVTDRSSIAVEAGYFNKPILFLENEVNKEKYIECFENLFNSYRKGSTYQDVEKFLDDCINNKFDNLSNQQKAFQKCVGHIDGLIGKRIVDDLYNSILEEIE